MRVSKASCFLLNFNFKFPRSLVPFNNFPNTVSFTRGRFFTSSNSSDSSSLTSTSSSFLSSRTLCRLKTSYVDRAYHAVPLVVSHFEEGEEKGDTATAFGSPPILGASQWQKRILAKEVDKKEKEEELSRPHHQRRGSQMVLGSFSSGISTGDQNSHPVSVPSNFKVTSTANPIGHSVNVVEPRPMPFLLRSLEFVVMQVKLDELCYFFHVPYSISIRVLETGELPLQAHRESGEIEFLIVALEYGVRFLLAPFVRKLLNQFPLHPFQVLSALYEQYLALYIL